MKTKLLLCVVLLCTAVTVAQTKTGTISGSITSPDKKPVAAATIQLLKTENKALLKTVISDTGGAFLFEHITPGKYLVQVSASGFEKKLSSVIEITVTSPSATEEEQQRVGAGS